MAIDSDIYNGTIIKCTGTSIQLNWIELNWIKCSYINAKRVNFRLLKIFLITNFVSKKGAFPGGGILYIMVCINTF